MLRSMFRKTEEPPWIAPRGLEMVPGFGRYAASTLSITLVI
jgi:hypothetical protein